MLAARSVTPKLKSARTIIPSTATRSRYLAQEVQVETDALGSLRLRVESWPRIALIGVTYLPESAGIVVAADALSKDTLSRSETAATATAETPAPRATASAIGETGAAGAAWCRRQRVAGTGRHRAQIIGEHHGIEV